MNNSTISACVALVDQAHRKMPIGEVLTCYVVGVLIGLALVYGTSRK